MVLRGFLALCLVVLSGVSAAAQSDRAVALVISVGEGTARADAIQAQLQVMGAETLRSADPSNAELRAMLKRFADEASNARASFVFLDGPAVTFEDREFLLPSNSYLNSPTDLFTQGIPLQAFARAAAQAEQGGAVVTTVGATPEGIPAELRSLTNAPDPVPGSSAILVAEYGSSDSVVQVMASAVRDEVIELGALLRRMQVGEGVTVSALPTTPIYIRAPAVTEDQRAGATVALEQQDDGETETLEELARLEQSLSRSAKRGLQRTLRDRGHYKGLVDGIFGPQTRAAISEFQSTRTEEATGVLTRRQLLDLQAPP